MSPINLDSEAYAKAAKRIRADQIRISEEPILTGGDPFAAGEAVTPGVLSAVPGALELELPTEVNGRRTALAQWIVSPENSLTSRVLVNRVWAFHFGRGIAGNPNNFGATGKKPTHPELLVWLAVEFIEYYNRARPSQAIHGIPDPYPELNEPLPRDGKLNALPVLGGIQHDYRLAA